MIFPLTAIDWTLPLQNPVLTFLLILVIILFAPIILNKFKIPHLIGLIIAGAIIGPFGFNVLARDSSIILSGTVGLLYIMFLAGLEIDMADFKKNSGKSLVFGLYTFSIPMLLGFAASYYLLHFSLLSSILLASMFASHTLIAYPIIAKFGVVKNRAVTVTVGGTLITDTLALLVLAVIVGMSAGEITQEFWIQLSVSILLFAFAVLMLFPLLARWFFKKYQDNVSQYIFVLALVFLGAFMAELAGIEPIIGAFLAGLALNRLIPHTSPLMNRIDFVGNAIFIPFFLISVGMLVNYRAFFTNWETIQVAVIMTLVACMAKFLAAWFTQKTFRFTADERRLIFGLSNSQAAATLAAVMVGYNIILNQADIDAAAVIGEVIEPVRLLGDSVLNGTIVMILFTCTIASFQAQKGAKNIALQEAATAESEENDGDERILIAVSKSDTVEELVNLSTAVKSTKNKKGLYALHVIDNNDEDSSSAKNAHKVLERAVVTAAATDNHLHELLRYDLNIVNGISNVVKEQRISDLVLAVHDKKGISDSFVGHLTEGILKQCNTTTLIYKAVQPLATIKRHLVLVPEHAEREAGFPFWLLKVWNIARNTGARLVFYASPQTLQYIREIQAKHPVPCDFVEFFDWDDLLIVARDVHPNDNLIIVLSRKDQPSYHKNMRRIPAYLNRYFQATNFILVYPIQSGTAVIEGVDSASSSVLNTVMDINDIGQTIARLFRRK